MISYTPGPWRIGLQTPVGIDIYADKDALIATVACVVCTRGKTNARLIAAAPDLLKTLEGIVGRIKHNPQGEDITSMFCDLLVDAGRIIHAAKGEEDKE